MYSSLRVCVSAQVCLYEAAGFVSLGPSAVVHGQDKWIDMEFSGTGKE